MRTGRVVVLKSIAEVAARASTLISFPILSHFSGAGGYGAYSQINTIVTFVVPFASLGLGAAVMRYFALGPWDPQMARRIVRVFVTVAFCAGLSGALVWVTAPTIGPLILDRSDAPSLLRWGSALIFLSALEQILLNLLRSRERFVQFLILEFLQVALLVTAVATVLPLGGTIVQVLMTAAALKVVVISINGLFALRGDEAPMEEGEGGAGPSLRRMVAFGLPLSVAGLGFWLMGLGDRLVVGHHLPAADLGVYSAAFALASLLSLAGSPFYFPSYGRIIRANLSGREDDLANEISLFHRYLSLTVIPVAVFLTLVLPSAVRLMGGPRFIVSHVLAGVMVGGFLTGQFNGLAHYVLTARDKTVLYQNMWLACGALNLFLNLLLVPRFALLGAGLASLVSFVVLDVWIFVAANGEVDMLRAYRWDTAARASAIGCALGAILFPVMKQATLLGLTIGTSVFWIVYVLVMFLVREITSGDFRDLVMVFRNSSSLQVPVSTPSDPLRPTAGS